MTAEPEIVPDLGGASDPEPGRHRVLVIGGAGFLGSVLVRTLLARGDAVTVMDPLMYGDDGIRELYGDPRFEVLRADARDGAAVAEACRGMTGVVHLGGLVGDPACEMDRALTLEVNLDATRSTAEAAMGAGVRRFVFASTCAVYGAGGGELLTEDSPLRPVSLYAETKARSERVLLDMAGPSFEPVVLRFGTFYGASARPRFDLVVNLLVARAMQEGVITVRGGRQWRPFVHVRDGADAIVACLDARPEVVGGRVFNVGADQQNRTLGQVAALIAELIPGVRVVRGPGEPDEPDYRVSFARIRSTLGFVAGRTLADGILEIGRELLMGSIADYREARYSNHGSLANGAADVLRGRLEASR
jgi:nucleoside-diphosphate-sugar epimerase